MRKRLRKVANLQPGFSVIFFTKKAEIVTQCEQTVKQSVCFCDSTLHLVRVGEPKTAREKDPFSGRQPIRAAFGFGSATPTHLKPVRAQWPLPFGQCEDH